MGNASPVASPRAEPVPERDQDIVFYEGDDRNCSLCQDRFRHGDLVCRLRCRHMFHSDCWGRLMRAANAPSLASGPRTRHECPNFRGSGTLIAVWHYVDEEMVTQLVNGEAVPNELKARSEHFDVSTPPRTPRSPVTVSTLNARELAAMPALIGAAAHSPAAQFGNLLISFPGHRRRE